MFNMKRDWTLFSFFIIGFNAVSLAKECTSQGKFPNDQENSCVGYTICLFAGPGRFAQINLTCPNGFIFNHNFGQCTNVTGYECQPDFNCTEIGLFSNPFNEFCTSYIACVEGFNNIITARSIDCPENQTFNPNDGICVKNTDFQCNEQYTITERVEVNLLESTENSGSVNSQKSSRLLIIHFLIMSLYSTVL